MRSDFSRSDLMREGDLDGEIRKLARTALIRIYQFISRKNAATVRDICWSSGDSIDELLKKNHRWRGLMRPTGRVIREVENGLRRAVGRDAEKLRALAFFVDGTLSALEKSAADLLQPESNRKGPIGSEQPRDFRRALHVLMRGFPGRPEDAGKQEIYRQASELHYREKLSYARIARKLLPEAYNASPENATAQIKAGIKRLKNKKNGNKNSPRLSS